MIIFAKHNDYYDEREREKERERERGLLFMHELVCIGK
jgi:hypothetical protein